MNKSIRRWYLKKKTKKKKLRFKKHTHTHARTHTHTHTHNKKNNNKTNNIVKKKFSQKIGIDIHVNSLDEISGPFFLIKDNKKQTNNIYPDKTVVGTFQETYVVGTHMKRLCEALHMSTHNTVKPVLSSHPWEA